MTFIEQFETIKKKMGKLNTESLPKDLAMQVNLTDEDCGGIFYIANIGGNFAVEPYDYHDHTVMVTIHSGDFLKILSGKLDATDAMFRGLLQIDGNIDHALAIASLVKKAEKKPASKKTTSKKTATEKKASDAKKTTKSAKKADDKKADKKSDKKTAKKAEKKSKDEKTEKKTTKKTAAKDK